MCSPVLPAFDRQPLPIDSIPEDTPPREVIGLLVATILQLQGEVKARDEALEAFRRKPDRPLKRLTPDPHTPPKSP